jgi:hypothetical protein
VSGRLPQNGGQWCAPGVLGVLTALLLVGSSPDGRYVLLVVEKGAHPRSRGSAETEPGRGVYNYLWSRVRTVLVSGG